MNDSEFRFCVFYALMQTDDRRFLELGKIVGASAQEAATFCFSARSMADIKFWSKPGAVIKHGSRAVPHIPFGTIGRSRGPAFLTTQANA